ncbi:MAG TPA: acyl-CoA dehydratase activase [bacterium]|nr:acyl-CoA dehydratase activase [bacterium]
MAYYAGIDVGSLATKCVVVNDDGRAAANAALPTGVAGAAAARKAFDEALAGVGISAGEVARVVGTGYGRARVPFADRAVTEIMCHARGAFEHVGASVTVVDVGGQDVKAIRVNDRGGVAEFAMNDRCAAGTGRFLEIMARALEMDLAELAGIDAGRPDAAKVNNMCTVFAESEVVGLLHEGVEPAAIGAGILRAVAERVSSLASRLGGSRYVLSGGVALNRGFALALAVALRRDVDVLPDPQFVGALGAALLARG